MPTGGGPPIDVIAGLSAYLVLVICIGIWSSRYVRGLDDFLLGGRRLGPYVTAISERASGESAWFLMGLPGAAYALGFRQFWAVIGIAFGVFFSWLVIALPLRRASERLGALTLPDYFAASYPHFAVPLRIVSTVAILVFYISYLGAQILGAGKLFQSLFGWESPVAGAALGAAIVAAYTMLGGFLAVAWTDLLQGVMMALVALALPVLAIVDLGWSTMSEVLIDSRPAEFFVMGNFALDQAASGLGWGAAIGSLAWGLGYLGQPHLLSRYMAIARPEDVRRAMRIAMIWVLVAYWGVTLTGILGVAVLGPSITDRELVVAQMARALLPGWLAGLVMAGILAAIMSTADSQLLVATSAVVEDVVVRLLGVSLSRKQIVALSRVVTVILTAVAVLPLLSERAQRMIDTIVAYAWSGLGSTFGPALILVLWWRQTSGVGVLAGMVTGVVATIVWKNVDVLNTAVDLKVAAFFCSSVAVVAGSLLARRRVARSTTQPGTDSLSERGK
jgi:sodium/proline symporter